MNAVRRAARLAPALLALIASCAAGRSASPGPRDAGFDRIAESIRLAGLKEEGAYGFLRSLCGPGPRLTGSDGAARAVSWARETLASMGFATWLEPVTVQHWVRGEAEVDLMDSGSSGRVPLAAAALGTSVPTPPDGLTAKVVEVRSFEDLDKAGARIKGRIVFFNAPWDRTLMDTFRAYGEAASFRVRGASEAAKRGAVAAIVRSPTGRLDDHPHTGIVTYDPEAARIPAAVFAQMSGFYSFRLGASGLEKTYNDELAGQTISQQVKGFADLLNPRAAGRQPHPHRARRPAAGGQGRRSAPARARSWPSIRRPGRCWPSGASPSYDPNVISSNDLTAAEAAYDTLLKARRAAAAGPPVPGALLPRVDLQDGHRVDRRQHRCRHHRLAVLPGGHQLHAPEAPPSRSATSGASRAAARCTRSCGCRVTRPSPRWAPRRSVRTR